MKHLYPFNRFINESAANSGLAIISIQFEYEREIYPAIEGIISLKYPEDRDKRLVTKINTENEGDEEDWNEAIGWMLEYFQEKNELPPYTIDQLKNTEVEDYMSRIYKKRTADDRSEIHLEVMKLDMRDVLDINDTDFRDELLSLLGFDPEDTEDLMKFKDYGLT